MPTTGAMGDPHNTTWTITGAGATGPTTYYTPQTSAGNMTFSTTAGVLYPPAAELTSEVVLQRQGKEPIPLGKTIDAILERLCIIIPALDKLEKYPALKEAYENYKLIEALIQNDEDNK